MIILEIFDEDKTTESDWYWLKSNTTDWNEVKIKWVLTSVKRLNNIRNTTEVQTVSDLLDEWPHFKQSLGHELVN